jgi:hypothetical protein
MRLMRTITELWNDETLPIHDGLYRADDASCAVRLNSEALGGLEFGESFDVAALLGGDPEWVTSVDITHDVALPSGEGYLCCGEGSFGSEGFFARLDAARGLRWVVYLERSNPFHAITVDGDRATFRSTSGIDVTVPVDMPG